MRIRMIDRLLAMCSLGWVAAGYGQSEPVWTAYNDLFAGDGTGRYTTAWNEFGTLDGAPGSSGPLTNSLTGAALPARLTVASSGTIARGTTSGSPNPGTPAYELFNGQIDWSSGPEPTAPQIYAGAEVVYTFTGLDPRRRYNFVGTSVRGGSGDSYATRWTLIELTGAASSKPAHTAGSAIYTNGLSAAQVALNSGRNNSTGDCAAWDNIDPGEDGAFTIRCTQYTGPIPSGNASGSYGYSLMALRLREYDFTPSPVLLTAHPTNQTVLELSPVSFAVSVQGNPPPTLQWYRNGEPIPGATHPAYALSEALLADDGAQFKAVARNTVSNRLWEAASNPALLRVIPDTNPPVALSAATRGLTQAQIAFSKPLEPTSANDPTHYTIALGANQLTILSASLDSTGTNVLLALAPMAENAVHTLTVEGVTDRTAARNPVPSPTRLSFAAISYQPHNVGNLTPAGTMLPVTGGYDVTAGGADLGGTADQFFFSSLPQTGDFDVQVRLEGLQAPDAWARAGLIARQSTQPNSPFVAVLATPGSVGAFLASRSAAGGAASVAGSFPVNYPHTWLRLQRVGNRFTGYVSLDGRAWGTVSSVALSLSSTLEVGLAVCGHGQEAVARFRDLGPGSGEATPLIAPMAEPLGASSRATPWVFSEILYDPVVDGTNRTEFVELYNSQGTPADLGGYRLSGAIDYTFPSPTVVPGNGFVVVALDPERLRPTAGDATVLGPYAGELPKAGGRLRLRHRTGALFLEVEYGTRAPWPVAANGLGHSLVLARPSYGENDPRAWSASDRLGGSPGRADGVSPDPLRGVVINEFLARPREGTAGYVELYNATSGTVDLSGAFLTLEKQAWHEGAVVSGHVFASGTVLSPGGFLTIDVGQLGGTPPPEGGTIFLVNSNRTRIVDALDYEGQALGVARGRFPDGGPELYWLSALSPGAANPRPMLGEIVINELMCDPPSNDDEDQYVELYNRGTAAVDVGGWAFTRGIDFRIPPGTILPADGYLVVAKNAARLRERSGGALTAGKTVGDFAGTLAKRGEPLVLSAPEAVLGTNRHGALVTNTLWIAKDEVNYTAGGHHTPLAGGGGSSLEAKDPRSDRRHPGDWADSDETGKAEWTTITYTGKLDNGDVAADSLQVLLLGPGECLIDDVEVLNASGVNLVNNSTFASGASGWAAEGTHERSSWESAGGVDGGACYHLRAVERGDNQINRLRTSLKASLSSGTTATIRAKVRWLSGYPEILFRLRGKWLEAFGAMNLPAQPGTPGARNSRAVLNAPPAIYAVSHAPVLPAAGEAVRVTARLSDPDGLGAVTLRYRIDPSATYQTTALRDDGAGGDAVAGDGIYTATLPGQSAGTLVAFQITAADSQTPPALATYPKDAPTRECLVRFGETVLPGNLPVYRLWITQANFNNWSSRPKLHNAPLDFTFVLGNQRVIYNADGLFAGSPYISGGYSTPAGNRCGYSLSLPADDPFLGGTALVLDWPGGHGNEYTAQQEQMAYWLADQLDLPHCYRYHIRLFVNGVSDMQRGGVFEAINQPGRDFVKAWSPDDADGDLFKIERGYEFSDGGSLTADPMPRLQNYTTTSGAKKTARYRWNWLKRAYRSAGSFTNLFHLVDAVNATGPEPYTSGTSALVDVEEWMRLFAFEHIINNFDSWGHEIAKNMFAYKPTHGKWQLYAIDLDWLMLVSPNYSSSRYSNGNGPLFIAEDPTVVRMYSHPPFLRAYYRAVQDAVNGPLLNAQCDPVMDAKYGLLVANGVTACDGGSLVAPTALKNWFGARRRVLVNQLALVASGFKATASPASTSNWVTLSGVAPISVKTLDINGVAYEPVWTSVTNYTLNVPLTLVGTNRLVVQGKDWRGQALADASTTLNAIYTGQPAHPADWIRINEIAAWPAVPGASFVELHNASSQYAFDVTGWRLSGLDYSFPEGTVLLPGAYWVVARDREAFFAAHPGVVPNDVFAGNLSADGETLALTKPDVNGEPDVTIAAVRYEARAPWPAPAPGASLQLIDPEQDNRRVANWAVRATAPLATPGALNATSASLVAFPALWLNEVQPQNTRGIADRFGTREPWVELYNAGAEPISLDGYSLSDSASNLTRWPFPAGSRIQPNEFRVVFASGKSAPSTDTEWHANFRLAAGAGSVLLSRTVQGRTEVLDYLNYDALAPDRSYGALPDGQPIRRDAFYFATPGRTNDGAAAPLAVRINEWMASNTRTLVNPVSGRYDDWFELYNPAPTAADLGGCYLTGDLTEPTAFRIPAGYTVPAQGFLLVWADNNAEANTAAGDLHVNFKLSASGESIGLFNTDGTPIDTVTFGPQAGDVSTGRSPDGGDALLSLTTASPGAANASSAPRFVSVTSDANGEVALTWEALPSRAYQLQYRDDLSVGEWTNLGSPAVATAATLTARDPSNGAPRRFYRVVLIP